MAPTTAMATAISEARVVLSMRRPTQPSSAGSRVSEPSTIISTPSDEAMAIDWTNCEAHQRQAHQGDDHRRAGEQHGAAAGVDRLGDGVLDAEPELEALSVPRDDEQRVVDADAEADHRDHRVVKSGIEMTWLSDADERRGDAEAEQGDADREAHRQHRAEGQDQDDDGGDDAEQLALGQLELGERVTAVLDLHARWGLLLVAEVLDLRRRGPGRR